MAFQDLETQAAGERATRRGRWKAFRQMSPDVLEELLRKPLPDEQKESLQEYLLLERRKEKADLEEQEKRGDFREKAAVPFAAATSFLGSWSSTFDVVPPLWKPWVIFCFGVLGGLLWVLVRRSGFGLIIEARKQLALLGKVD